MSIKNIYPIYASTFSLYNDKDELAFTDISNLYSTAGGDIFLSKEDKRQRYVTYEFDLIEAVAGGNQKIEIPLVNRRRNPIKGLKLNYILNKEFNHVVTKEEVLNSANITNRTITANCLSINIAEMLWNCDIDNYISITFILSADIPQISNIAVFVAERNLKNIRINMESYDPMLLSLDDEVTPTETPAPSEVEEFINEQYANWKADILDTTLTVRDYEKYDLEFNDSVEFVTRGTDASMTLDIEVPNVNAQDITYNQYGSIINEETRQEATGYFYTKVVNGRYRVIDPDGYVHTIKNVMFPLPTLSNANAIQIKEDVITEYNTTAWKNNAKNIMKSADFNCYEQYYNLITEDKFTYSGMNCISKFPILDSWSREFNLKGMERGRLCNILHPKFKDRAHFKVKQILIKEPQQSNTVVAYILDNEPYFEKDDLITCIYTQNELLNYRSEAAFAWLKNRLGIESVSFADITDALCDEFLSFEFYVYSKIITDEISAMNDNHMVFTPAIQWFKFSAAKGFLADNQNFFKVINKFYDALALTHYSTYDVLNEGIDELRLNIPVFLNEFSMKSLDRPEFIDGLAGPAVGNQTDRAKYFEHIATQCIKNRNCIGYTWYQYSDINHEAGVVNRGIVDRDGNLYSELHTSMTKINSNVETIINS